jgi:hypothetical protein
LLLEYVAGVSNKNLRRVFEHVVTGTAQKAPECDRVLVHDDDLARIREFCGSEVSMHPILVGFVLYMSTVIGSLPTRCREKLSRKDRFRDT